MRCSGSNRCCRRISGLLHRYRCKDQYYLWAANVDLQGTPENTPNYKTSNEKVGGSYFSDAQIEADAATYKDGYFAERSEHMVPGTNVRKAPYAFCRSSAVASLLIAILPHTFQKVSSLGFTGLT